MIFEWETDKERLLKFMKIPPKEKMIWLLQMNIFLHKASSKRTRAIRQKLRENR